MKAYSGLYVPCRYHPFGNAVGVAEREAQKVEGRIVTFAIDAQGAYCFLIEYETSKRG